MVRCIKGCQVITENSVNEFFCLEIVFIFTKSVDPNEVQHGSLLFAEVLVYGFPEYKGLSTPNIS